MPAEKEKRVGVHFNSDSFWSADSFSVGVDIFRRLGFVRGECNNDGEVNLTDALCSLTWLFSGGSTPDCLAALNVNGDASVNIADPIALLNFLFAGGPAPKEPFPDCGPNSPNIADGLGCDTAPGSCL